MRQVFSQVALGLGLFGVTLVGCTAAPDADLNAPTPEESVEPARRSGPQRTMRVWLEPGDLSTDAASTPLVARAHWPGSPPAHEVFAELAASLSLTDHSGAGIEGDARLPDEASLEFGGYADVEFVPRDALPPGWYVLRVDGLRSFYEISALQRVLPQGDGASGAVRFHVGSAPRVQHVMICQLNETDWSVVAEFSERIRVSDSLAMAELLRPHGPPCSRDIVVDPMTPSADDAESITSLRWGCTALAPREALDLLIPSGTRALSGVPMPTARFSFGVESGVGVNERCVLHRGDPGQPFPAYEAL